MNLNELLATGRSLRDQIELLNEQVKALEKERDAIDSSIMELMIEQGVQRTGNDFANVSLSEQEFVNASDWEKLGEFIITNNALHLLQRRISSTAALEYKKAGEELPGVTYGTTTKLSFRRK